MPWRLSWVSTSLMRSVEIALGDHFLVDDRDDAVDELRAARGGGGPRLQCRSARLETGRGAAGLRRLEAGRCAAGLRRLDTGRGAAGLRRPAGRAELRGRGGGHEQENQGDA